MPSMSRMPSGCPRQFTRPVALLIICLFLLDPLPTQPLFAASLSGQLAPLPDEQPVDVFRLLTPSAICPDVVAPPGVDTLDIQAVAAHWPLTRANPDPDGNPATPNYEARYDIDQDGDVDVMDIMLTSAQWSTIGAPPGIEITSIPPYGSWYVPMGGRVGCVDPAAYRVVVYIFVEGWWTKPTFANPSTIINPDGTWQTNVTTGGCDNLATRFAAFLVPVGAPVTSVAGSSSLPAAMLVYPHVIVGRLPGTRTIQFSGATWVVKSTGTCRTVGPGDNYFSDAPGDVYVDQDGYLHLSISYHDSRWWSTEVINTDLTAYGAYTFILASRVDTLDPNAVTGLFTWDELDEVYSHTELDVEFSRWSDPGALQNAQYVVQPYQTAGNRHQFAMQQTQDTSTHRFLWQPGSVRFASYQGAVSPPAPSDLIESWVYTGADMPPAGQANVRLNLWLVHGSQPPASGQPLELIVQSFDFTPAPE